MIIKGEFSEYKMDWRSCGWAYANAIVKKRAKLFGLIPYWKTVWDSSGPSTVGRGRVEKFHPHEFENWFKEVIKEYEDYERAWEGKR
jgi:hypothetical protein